MKNNYEKLMKKRKIIEKIFMGVILLFFLAFLLLWTRTELTIARYAVGAALLAVVFIFKLVDKKLEAECKNDGSGHGKNNER